MKHIYTTGFLLLGILSFCFGQSSSNEFNIEMDSYGTSNKEKYTAKYLLQLDILSSKYSNHLESNCYDQAKIYRNYSRHYYGQKSYDLALSYIQDSALHTAKLCVPKDDNLIAQIYQNTFLTYKKLQDTSNYVLAIDSLIYYLDYQSVDSIKLRANLENSLGFYFGVTLGQIENGRIWLRKSIADYDRLGLEDEKALRPINMLASFETNAGNNELAIQEYEKVLFLAKKLKLTDQRRYSSSIYYNKAIAHKQLKQNTLALQSIENGKKAAIGNGDDEDYAVLLGLEASIIFEMGKFTKSLEYVNQAIVFLTSNPDSVYDYLLADFQNTKFKSLIELDRNREARITAVDIITAHSYGLEVSNESFSMQNAIIRDLGEFAEGTRLYLQSIKDPASAKYFFTIADQLDSLYFEYHNSVDDQDRQTSISESYHSFCDNVLSYIFSSDLQNEYPEKSAYYISSSKSLKLFKSLNKEANIPLEIKREYKLLTSQQASIQSRLEKAIESDDMDSINYISEQNFKFYKSKVDFNEKLAKLDLDTDYRKHKNNFIDFAQSNLEGNQALIDLFSGDEYTYGYNLDKTGIQFHFDSTLAILQNDRFLDIYSESNADNAEMIQDSINFFFADFFAVDFAKVDHLTIIPDGNLLFFPFETLLIEEQKLIQRAAVHYAFSFNINNYKRKKAKAKHSYAGFGMSYSRELLDEIKHSDQLNKLFKKSFQLSPLPNAVREINESQEIFEGLSFLNEDCTSSAFRENCSDTKILHIANHSLLNKNSKLSSIIFGNKGNIELLNVIDIKSLDLKAELAILSSCNSGRGELFDGEGIRSLGQSFAEAGCNSVIVNLWDANDKSSRFIISSFNKYLKEGSSKSEALRQAKLNYLDQATPTLSHPKYWANVVLIGNPDPIQFTSSISNWWFYLIATMIIIGLFVIFRKRTN